MHGKCKYWEYDNTCHYPPYAWKCTVNGDKKKCTLLIKEKDKDG